MSVNGKKWIGEQHREAEATKALSAFDFQTVIKPVLENHFSGRVLTDAIIRDGRVYETEYGHSQDLWSGRDGHIEICKRGQHGARYNLSFAYRLQWIKSGSIPYNSFTVREWKQANFDGYETELAKMIDAWSLGYDRPQLIIQAYLMQGTKDLVTLGIARFDHVAKFLSEKVLTKKEKPGKESWFRSQVAGARFIVLPWEYLQYHGVPVTILTPSPAKIAV